MFLFCNGARCNRHMATLSQLRTIIKQSTGIRIVLIASSIVMAIGLFHHYGRSMWHPLLIRFSGGVSVGEVMGKIATTHPDLITITPREMVIICYKHERRIDVYCDRVLWKSFVVLAASGGLGPKLRAGDRQVPEGLYHVDAVNPNSSYHLSLRVSYPNEVDVQRAEKIGVKDLGGDIYIHGHNVSIGCIAIGDEAIEELFYVVNKMNYKEVEVIISPTDYSRPIDLPMENAELYRVINERITAVLNRGRI